MEKINSSLENELSQQRPKDIKFIIILKIIGFILSPGIFITFFLYNADNIQGYHNLFFLLFWIIFTVIGILYLILTSIGLLKGEKFAKTVTIILQLVYFITYSIVLIALTILFGGISTYIGFVFILPIFISIIFALRRPDVAKYFNKNKFNKIVKSLLLISTIFLICFNFLVTCLFVINAEQILPVPENKKIDILPGIWENKDETIVLKIYKDYKCTLFENNTNYTGTWKFDQNWDSIELTLNGNIIYRSLFIDYQNKEMTLFSTPSDTFVLKKSS